MWSLWLLLLQKEFAANTEMRLLREELIQSNGNMYYNMPLLLYCFLLHCVAKIDCLIDCLIVVLCQVSNISAYLRDHIYKQLIVWCWE